MKDIYGVDVLNREYGYYLDDRYFIYPLIIGMAIIGLLLINYFIFRKRFYVFILMIILAFGLSLIWSFVLSQHHMKITHIKYNVEIENKYALRKVKKKYDIVSRNKDGTYTVIEYLQ